MKSKKGFSISLETIVVTIIILVVLVVIIIFFYTSGGSLFSFLGDRTDSAVSGAKDISFPKP